MKEEHVDGGYLVTLGTYTSPEDFNKQIVRQLQIERKLAPFWRGLNDFSDQWTEPQIIAAARGLPIPPADEVPPEELIPRPVSASPQAETIPNLDSLTVPIGDRSQSTASDHAASIPSSALPSPISAQAPRAGSPFKPRGKAIAAVLGGSSRNGSTTEIVPREINLPHDPFVNGQPIEVFLYKDSTECPICFLTYPPYLNHTRCCDQPICSECFVQIKRPDPHFPEGHNENDPNHNPEETAGLLVSEPACCPYCTQPDFGVSYEPPPFRRGLTYSISPTALGTASAAIRLEDLEEMMLAEAREKEARKAAKAAAKHAGPYESASGRSGQSSASGSSLSLPGLGFGRKRGNSAASNLRIEASVASAMASGESREPASKDKGKGVDRAASALAEGAPANTADPVTSGGSSNTTGARPIPHLPAGPSHLRQMSNASSVSSSILDSQPGSYTSPSHLQDPRGSGLSLGSRSNASEDGGDQDRDRDPSTSTEPMFNFRSLAEVVGVSLEGENAGRRLSVIAAERKAKESGETQTHGNAGSGEVEEAANLDKDGEEAILVSHTENAAGEEQPATPANAGSLLPPTVTITPDTPGAGEGDNNSKQLGCETAVEHVQPATH
ncbi:hypothetical protein NEMBOFW57_008711 [Staphylotrichum longicolle]|uniref:Protein sip5 n=1 Tax=Staphylotrichum longicolle TaxID=669026 RepID=A0AAD4EVM4_9PEZI|nr:hypothetical protein NEMBOFW57_008711 [Staphylotrichum longicolle]